MASQGRGPSLNRVRNIVQLEVTEHGEPEIVEPVECRRAGLGVELVANLGNPEPGGDTLGDRDRGVEIANVERQRQSVTNLGGGINHRGHSGLRPSAGSGSVQGVPGRRRGR